MKARILRFTAAAVAVTMLAPMQGCGEAGRTSSPARVKNVILMVGDGMGLAQVSALMLAADYEPVNMERAPVGGFVKTYSANNRVTDSAAAATAYSTGEKTNNGYLGVDADGAPLETILEKAESAGLATGLVATTHIMHATPGAFYAHTPNRNDYEGIALGLLDSGIDVAIGGGINYLTGRADGRNLIAELERQGYTVTDTLADLDYVTGGQAMALYDEGDIPKYIRNGRDPMMLARGTTKALEILTANTPGGDGGFFLMVEGSWVDSAGHGNDSEMLLGEMLDFDNAVGEAFDYADAHPGTLVIVVADHETGGLTLPSGNENFLLPDSGVEFRWSTGGHTGTLIPLFAYGAHADFFGGVMDNTEVNHRMVELLGLK
jgi:alkaline phosphatase